MEIGINMDLRELLNLVFLASPWVALVLLALAWFLRSRALKALLLVAAVLGLTAGWMRYVEPFWIKVETHQIQAGFKARIAVAADFHLGMFKDQRFLRHVVRRLNELENIDFVAIPGDFTYYPDQNLTQLFAPLADLRHPAFAVLGNHDSERPGPYLRDKLAAALKAHGVNFLHNQSANFKDFEIVGLGDHWAGEDDTRVLQAHAPSEQVIVIFHNPDTSAKLPTGRADLSIAGHTHGGQVRIPWLYKRVIPTKCDFDKGLYDLETGKLFISAGLGETALPIRLFNRAVIDVLELR